ncbi:MAG: hypothetical protein LC789_03485 [Actinobacteria bacterium]|nr:hypothetical protein [Actinomycetota bacterium]MCA1721401.1 hypothetical protein [Actinomycetota bacterium]
MHALVRRTLTTAATGALILVGLAGPASAHTHEALAAHQGAGQVLANGALHNAPVNGQLCGGDPASYGLETAHHGPDSGVSGKSDGCYQPDSFPLYTDINNPHIG